MQLLHVKCRHHENPDKKSVKMEVIRKIQKNKLNIKKEVPRKSNIRTRI